MPTTLSPTVAIADCARACMGYGGMLFADIPAEKFAFKPHPKINHPAWCVGHLVYAANGALDLMERKELVDARPAWDGLFEMGSECLDDASKYPGKDELIAAYVKAHESALLAVGEVDIELLSKVNPWEGRFREMFPTVGSALNFLLVAHHMTHLGQVSSWRRCLDMDGVLG